MSEQNSTDDELNFNSTITRIRDEINFIHAETYNARKALLENLSAFTKRFEAIDGRLNRIEQFLLNRAIGKEPNNNDKMPAEAEGINGGPTDKATKGDQTLHKWGGGHYVREDVDETNTKTIANSRPERAKRAIRQPERYVPETKKSRKGKAVEIKEEEGSDGDDRPIHRKKHRASESDAAPKKKKVRGT